MSWRPGLAVLLLAGLGLVTTGCGDNMSEEESSANLLPSGLRYKDTLEGNGQEAKKGDVLEVLYTGTLKADGKKFDSTDGRGPFRFVLGNGEVIKGWDEGVAGMKVGGKRKLWIPAALGYGPRGTGAIPANSDLVFEVELMGIVPPAKLEITDLVEGTGATAKVGDTVSVHYTGKLKANGEKFDSSLDHGSTFEFKLGDGQVIKGWDQGVPGMKVGGKRQLLIPFNLAYGASGSPPKIPPRADLVFDVELVAIK
jgi:FKBP-type peptidyl-prolyl cis-trans isomerase